MSREAVVSPPNLRFERAARALQDAGSTGSGPHTLVDLKKGQRVTISAIDSQSPEVQRLMTLGLVEGAEVELAGRALGGDPIEVRLFGRGVSLRKEQARCFSCATAGVSD